MLNFNLLIFGDTGWGDEMLFSCIMTILVSLSAMGLGVFIAIFTAWAKISGNIVLKIIANFYTTVIRGVPELLVIYLIFFGSSAGIMYISKPIRQLHLFLRIKIFKLNWADKLFLN